MSGLDPDLPPFDEDDAWDTAGFPAIVAAVLVIIVVAVGGYFVDLIRRGG